MSCQTKDVAQIVQRVDSKPIDVRQPTIRHDSKSEMELILP